MATKVIVETHPQQIRKQRFDTIIQRDRDRLGRIARVYAPQEQEDLIQEMLMQIWRGLPKFSGQSSLSTWAYRVALNTAISWRRRAARAKRQTPGTRIDSETLAGEGGEDNLLELLWKFIPTLSDVDQVVLLMFLEDHSYDEIAEFVGVSNGAIRTRISRIRSQLESWECEDD